MSVLNPEIKNKQKAVEFMETYGGSINHEDQMTFIKELPEELDTPIKHQMLITIGVSKRLNFWPQDGVYIYEDPFEDLLVYFAVRNVVEYDIAYRELHFKDEEDLVAMLEQFTKYIKIGLYKKEQELLKPTSEPASEWIKLGPTDRTALYTALQANERPAKFAKTCWKMMNGIRIEKPPKSRKRKVMWNVVDDEISYGRLLLEKENDTTDSFELDISSTLDDYDNYNYTGKDTVVNLEGRERDYGYYGW